MNFCFEAESSNSQHLQKDFVCSRAVRQKPSDSRSPSSTLQAWCLEGFQKLGNTVSVACNRLPALNSNLKANRSCITSPFSCKANPALPALLTTSLSCSCCPEHISPRAARLTASGKIPPTRSSRPNLLFPVETGCFSANP